MKDIVAAIEQQERLATGKGALAEERSQALDRYLGRPYGDEMEGRSQVVMRDVADTIEWIKPSLLKVFCSGDEVVQFNAFGPEDEEQAKQETDWCNYVLNQKNNGFLVLHDWFHDALLQKNGYVMAQYVTEKVSNREQFKGLSDDEFALLAQDEIEIVEHTETDMGGEKYHDVVVKRAKEYGCVKLTNIPPERALVASDWPGVSLEGCPFFEMIDWVTISDLRQQGYDVEDTINDTSAINDDEWEEQRRETEFDGLSDRENLGADPATRRVRVRYVWMNYDADEDGIAELRHIVIVGKTPLNGEFGEEDDLIPVACITPMRQPHEHYGQSVHDIVEDLQRIRTVLMRGFLDNMYLANNGRNAVNKNTVNLDDLLVTRPGGVVRVDGAPQGEIVPMIHPQDGGSILQAIEFIDTVRENRSGVTKYNQGLDANSLNKTATGVQQIMNASQQRIELIARVFAETGVKALMLIIHALSVKHTRQQEMIKLRNKWVPMDPRQWKTRKDVTVTVGLGTGNKDQMLQHLMMILQAQREAIQIGIATPKNIYNALAKLTQNAGFKNAEEFWTDPEMNPPQPQGPPEAVQVEQLKQQGKAQELQFQAQVDQQKQAAQSQDARYQAELQMQLAEREAERTAELERFKAKLQASVERYKAELSAAVEREKAQMSAQAELEKTAMSANAQVEGAKASVAPATAQQADISDVRDLLREMAANMNRPRSIIRDDKGRVAGVQ